MVGIVLLDVRNVVVVKRGTWNTFPIGFTQHGTARSVEL